jgi:glycosyltransferase involved in cell wall biosynthesis
MSGTMSKDYIYTSKKLSKECNIVSVQDTMISNSIKQFIQVGLYKFYFRTFIQFFWGVGTSQTRFGLKMGFKEEQIKEGFYVASRKFFENIVNPDYDLKNQSFLFIGRLVREKNIMMLASVIDKINSETGSSHILKVIGDGDLKKQLLNYKCVRCYGILSQDEIIKVAKQSHLFHEMTALGLPVIASYECGSAIDLVINEYNGYKFNSKDYNSLMQVIKNYLSLSSKDKSDFSKNSIKISRKINHENWNNTLISLLKN